MAESPRFYDTPCGRVHIRYLHPFTQRVAVQFCWAHQARIDHNCDEMGCWPTVEDQ